jgi:hypothetical protein
MSATFSRRLVGVVAASCMLVGCTHRPESTVVDSPQGPIIVAEPQRKSRILQFCEDYEMVCILGGIAAFGAAVAIIKANGDDHN